MKEIITMAHGSGGSLTSELINNIFYKHFNNSYLDTGDDSARIVIDAKTLAFTTDSFVITPIFFNGGDIGKLSICGTVNDLVTSGAKPLYLSCGFIIEEGLSFKDLELIVISMANEAKKCGVKIVTGDTKVVQRGACDKIFINTSGIGIINPNLSVSGCNAESGDLVICTGDIGDHGCSILIEREKLNITSKLESDCAPLNDLIESIIHFGNDIKVLRDPTRGGLATTLNEIAKKSNVGIIIFEDRLPINDNVRGVSEILGLDPLYMANEGKMVIIVKKEIADEVVNILKLNEKGKNAKIIGEVISENKGKLIMETITGSLRIIDVMVGDPLPRIC